MKAAEAWKQARAPTRARVVLILTGGRGLRPSEHARDTAGHNESEIKVGAGRARRAHNLSVQQMRHKKAMHVLGGSELPSLAELPREKRAGVGPSPSSSPQGPNPTPFLLMSTSFL